MRRPIPRGNGTVSEHTGRVRHLKGVLLGVAVVMAASSPLLPLDVPPGPAQEAFREGVLAMRAEEPERAIRAFERAAALAPQSEDVFLNLGIARSSAQDWNGAIEAYRKVLALNPANSMAHNNIGNVHFRRGDHAASAEAYREALRLNPEYLLATYHLGWIVRQMNQPEEAEQLFKRCLALSPSNDKERLAQEDARFYLGTLRFRAKDFAATASIMEQVLSVRPAHPEAHYYLGQAYLRMGQVERGRLHLDIHKKILDATPKVGPVASGGPP